MKVLKLIPVGIVLVLVLVYALCEANKAYWDYRVQIMCDRDGGTKVFESVFLTKNEAMAEGLILGTGDFSIPSKSHAAASAYFIDSSSEEIRAVGPRVIRSSTKLVRKSDLKVLAEMTSYGRIGGDFPTFAYPSVTTCSHSNDALAKFRTAIQVKEK